MSRGYDIYSGDHPGNADWDRRAPRDGRDEEREPVLPQTVIVRPPNVLVGFRRYCLGCGVDLDDKDSSCGACAAWKEA